MPVPDLSIIRLALISFFAISACARGRADEGARADAPPVASDAANPGSARAPSAPSPVPAERSSASPTAAPVVASAAPTSPACDKICSRSRELRCPREALCLQGCAEMAQVPGCAPQFERLYACLASQPLSHWECAEDGVGAIRDGYCEKEQGAAAGCVEKQTSR